MLRKKIPFTRMAFATLLGVAGGFYIYRPYYDVVPKTTTPQNQDVALKENGSSGKNSSG